MAQACMLDEALRLASLGYRVFPLAPLSKQPLAGSRGVLDATSDAETIRAWWAEHPDANIGVACGSGLLALDVDPGAVEAYGVESVADLELDWIGRPRSRTPRGGFHLFMRAPEGVALRNSAGRLGAGLDLKTDGGYVVAPPSHVVDQAKGIDGLYEWVEPLECSPDELPDCPAWLVERLREIERDRAGNGHIAVGDGEAIPEGRRNDALASIAGHLRRIGLDPPAIAAALHQVNAERCRPPLEAREVERIAASIGRYEPRVDLAGASGVDLTAFLSPPTQAPSIALDPQPVSVGELVKAHPLLRPPVIHDLLREGETMNVIASPKTGKSWLTLDLAIAVATGRPWLGRYATEPGDVLIIDNELHRETSAHRIPKVAETRGVAMREIGDRIFVDNVRGRLLSINGLAVYSDALEPGRFKVVILDAFYRFMPVGGDENDNGTMANIYNAIDRLAERLGCCFVLIHHSTKGNQSGKSVTDVGAGAGAQSRATDTHLVLRPHEEDGVVVLDAAVRSWAPIEPVCLRWEFPVWSVDESLDPAALRSEKPRKRDDPGASWTPELFTRSFVATEPALRESILAAACETGLSKWRATCLLREAEAAGLIVRESEGRNRPSMYALAPAGKVGEA